MAGRRSLTPLEERMLIAVTRKMTPRDGCLVTCQWMTGYRSFMSLCRISSMATRGDTPLEASIVPYG